MPNNKLIEYDLYSQSNIVEDLEHFLFISKFVIYDDKQVKKGRKKIKKIIKRLKKESE